MNVAYSFGQPDYATPAQEARQIEAQDFAENAIDAIPPAVHDALNALYPDWYRKVSDHVELARLLVLEKQAHDERMGSV